MGIVNTETVVMMGAALAAAGNVQGQEAVQAGERTIGWNEAKNVADRTQETVQLRAALKAQCPDNMKEAVGRVFAGYDIDKLKDVRATLKTDGEKLNYMIDGNRFELSGGFDGRPLNTEIFGRDGSRVQSSQGENRSSTVIYDADGNMTAYVQKDERTGNVAGEFRDNDAVFRVEQAAGRVKAQITDRDSQMTMNVNGNRMSMQMESEDLGILKGSARIGADGTVRAKASLDEREGGEGVYSTGQAKISRSGNLNMSVRSIDEEGVLEDTVLKVGKDGYSFKGVEEGEKINESGKDLNAAILKKALESRGRL